MNNDLNYQDAGLVTDSEPEGGSSKRSGSISVPTVLASAGVAALVSAIIVTIGVVGVLVTERDNSSSAAQPTVVNLGSAQNPQQQAAVGANQVAPAPAPGQPAPAAAPVPAAAPTENVPESGGGGQAPAQTPTVAPAQAPGGGATASPQAVAAAPAALTPGQLNTKVKTVMNSNASRAARAAELEGGERALRQIDAVAQALTIYGNVGFSYQMVGPVQVSGTTLTAPLQISVVGRGSQNRELTWVWAGDKWKLSNRSVCTIAGFVMLPCSL